MGRRYIVPLPLRVALLATTPFLGAAAGYAFLTGHPVCAVAALVAAGVAGVAASLYWDQP